MNYKLYLISIILILFNSCNRKNKSIKEIDKLNDAPKLKLFLNEQPINFNAKTIDGYHFNSLENKDKYWVIFIYDKGYLKSSNNYDMPSELNYTYERFKDNVSFIGIIEGLIDSENELYNLIAQNSIKFKQIDNTKAYSFKKEEKLNYNIYCSPAKIIINPNGKVIFSSCGGKTETINYKLDSIIHNLKK